MATDRVQKEYNLLNEKVQKLHHDLEEQIHTNTQLLAENSQKVVELKQKDAEIEQIKVGQGGMGGSLSRGPCCCCVFCRFVQPLGVSGHTG